MQKQATAQTKPANRSRRQILTIDNVPANLRAQIVAPLRDEIRQLKIYLKDSRAQGDANLLRAVDEERLRAEGLSYVADELRDAIHNISPEDVVEVAEAGFDDDRGDDFRYIHNAHAEFVASYERWLAVCARSVRNRDRYRAVAYDAEQAEATTVAEGAQAQLDVLRTLLMH